MKHPGRKILSLLLALVVTFAPISTALADKSTTTNSSASVDQNARTEMYVVSQAPGSDYPVFNAKNEPKGGVYYGRYTRAGSLPGGGWGLINQDAISNESIVGHYIELDDTYGLEYWSYIFGKAIQDGSRAFLVSLNFVNEASDCAAVNSGSYDSKLIKDFQYLNTLSCPVFIRVAGEVNVWDNRPPASDYISAFRRVSGLIRAHAPKAAVVFSPNYSSENRLDLDTFYPGDEYVDWVGCSLYYNAVHHSGQTGYDKFFGVGNTYGDPLLNVQQTVNLSKLHKKPVMATEGGSAFTINGKDYASFASERMDRALSFLPMVYPEIKAVVTSNYDGGGEGNYSFEENSTANAGYQHGAANNPALLHSLQDAPSYYTKASSYSGSWEGAVKLAAYTWSADKLTATWSVDGQTVAESGEYPYAFTLDASALSSGKHTVQVTFSNGASKSCEFRTKSYIAAPTDDKLYVDGQLQTPTVYKIGDNNYFKLRDLAILLNGSAKQFSVGYDAALGAVQVFTGRPYTPDGSELAGQASASKDAAVSDNVIYIDNELASGLTVYQIDGNNYFKLRDLGQALDFYVGWDAATGMSISGSEGYQG